jgi:transcriptional regulator with XRE-family HTH domain
MTGSDFQNLRKTAGLTQRQLADLIGVHPQTVGAWERTEGEIVSDDMKRLSILSYAFYLLSITKKADLTKKDRYIIAPSSYYGMVDEGDILILSDDPAEDIDILVLYNKEGQAENLGRYFLSNKTRRPLGVNTSDGYLLPLPDRSRYRVVEAVIHRLQKRPDAQAIKEMREDMQDVAYGFDNSRYPDAPKITIWD